MTSFTGNQVIRVRTRESPNFYAPLTRLAILLINCCPNITVVQKMNLEGMTSYKVLDEQ